MREWKVIHDADDEETGKPSLWSTEINSKDYGRFAWIALDSKKRYSVEVQMNDPGSEFTVLKRFRSFKSAKEWAENL